VTRIDEQDRDVGRRCPVAMLRVLFMAGRRRG
jgi:hypothetical protein